MAPLLGSEEAGLGSVPTAAGAGDTGGGGSGTIKRITSVDGSVTVANPTGPTTDLSVSPFQGWDVGALNGQSGILVWEYAPKAVIPAENLDPKACAVVAAFVGGQLRATGVQTILFTADGGKPRNGAPCFLAASTDDTFTGRGKATATRPELGQLTPQLQPPKFPQNTVLLGTVVDNANYDSLGTCAVLLNLPASNTVEQKAGVAWNSAHFSNFHGPFTDYYTAPGGPFTNGQTGALPGQTICAAFEVVDPTLVTGANELWTNVDPTDNGWIMSWHGGGFEMEWLSADGGVHAIAAAEFGALAPGIHVVMISIELNLGDTFPSWRACLDGRLYLKGDFTGDPTPPDGTFVHTIGGGTGDGWTVGTIFGVGVVGRAMEDSELINISKLADPTQPINRLQLPPAFTSDPALFWYWQAPGFDGTFPANVSLGAGGEAFAFSKVGAPTVVNITDRWYRRLGSNWLDTDDAALSSLAFPWPTCGARLAFTVDTPEQLWRIGISYENSDTDDSDNQGAAIFFNGVFVASSAKGIATAVDSNGVVIYSWLRDLTNVIPTFPVLVEVVAPLSDRRLATYDSGGQMPDLVLDSGITFEGPATARRMLLIGDGQTLGGHDQGIDTAAFAGATATLIRADYPGRVTAKVDTSTSVLGYSQWGNGSVVPFAKRCAQMANEGDPATLQVLAILGWWDYFSSEQAPAPYAVMLGQLLDALHAALPSAAIWMAPPVQTPYYAVANLLGHTLQEYVDAANALTTGRAWLQLFDATSPNAITFGLGNGNPTIGVGTVALHDNIRAAGVY